MPFLLFFFRNRRRKRRLLQPSRSLRRALPATQKKSGDRRQNSEVRIQNKTEFEFKLNSVSWILTPEFLVLKLPHTFIHAFVRKFNPIRQSGPSAIASQRRRKIGVPRGEEKTQTGMSVLLSGLD
jgi:hypothetical protein